MESIYKVLDPSTVRGAILCSLIASLVFGGLTWVIRIKKKRKTGDKESNIQIGGDNIGDIIIGSKVNNKINVNNNYNIDETLQSKIEDVLKVLTGKISTSSSDKNFSALLFLLNERVEKRIGYLSRLDLTNWMYEKRAYDQRDRLLSDLQLFDENIETKIQEIITRIGKEASAIEILYNEYVELEKEQISLLISNIVRDSASIYIETGMDQQNYIRAIIEKVIAKYNENIEFITKAYSIKGNNPISNKYIKIHEKIYYSDLGDRNKKIEATINNIRASGDVSSINIIQHSKEIVPLHLIPHWCGPLILNGDLAGSEVITVLEGIYESIDETTLRQFYPHHHKNHVLFFIRINKDDMDRLSRLQDRSNIAYYFFEKR